MAVAYASNNATQEGIPPSPASIGSIHGERNGVDSPDMADLRPYNRDHALRDVSFDDQEATLLWSDGHISRFHHGWLRENCPSPSSRHPLSKERLVHPLSIPDTIKPLAATIEKNGALRISWNEPARDGSADHHTSIFDAGWLRAHCYSRTAKGQIGYWEMRPAGHAPEIGWHELMQSEASFYRWLIGLVNAGWSIVSGVPGEDGACVRLGQKMGVIRSSNFGFTFDVQSKPNPNSNAYTALRLPLHTDMPHYDLPPGFQLLHCLASAAEGGESLLVDGIAVAGEMKSQDKEAYELLTTETIPFRFQDDDGDYTARHFIIECDLAGQPIHVNWSNSTSAPLDVPHDRMAAMRRAVRVFLEKIEDPRFLIQRKLNAGEMLVFDNRRMLHGRNAFDTSTGDRHLQGCYLDTAEIRSRLAVLARHHERPCADARAVPL